MLEYREWLRESKNLFFDELTGADQRSLFEKFVEKWNDKDLPEKYYRGIRLQDVDGIPRTRHHWKFAEKLDQMEMGLLRDSIAKDTNQKKAAQLRRPGLIGPNPPPVVPTESKPRPDIQQRKLGDEDQLDYEDDEERLRKLRAKKDSRDYKKHKEVVEEELVPKATGREALIEKKKAQRAYNKSGDDSPEHNERDLLGGSSDFSQMLKRKKERDAKKNEAKQQERQEKLANYQAKEEEKMAVFRMMVASGNIPLLQPRPQ